MKAEQKNPTKKTTRRDILKAGVLGIGALVFAKGLKGITDVKKLLKGKRLAMVIDLQRCTGCGGCIIACKNENNLQDDVKWSNKISRTVGKFPNVRFEYFPTLCNHCENAPCIRVCPTMAMHKREGGVTVHNPDKCIGCKSCMAACPYGVIYFNKKNPHQFWKNESPLINGCTPSAKEVTEKVGGKVLPNYNPSRENSKNGIGIGYKGIVEKCDFCYHRVKKGKLPNCVEACPANARIFGDLNDPNSEVSRILGKYRPLRLKEHIGTEPKVFYVRSFNPAKYESSKGKI